jgi:hypothetical protein
VVGGSAHRAPTPSASGRVHDVGEASHERVTAAIAKAQDAITVRRVYGEPYERDGVVVIAAAEIRVDVTRIVLQVVLAAMGLTFLLRRGQR